MEFENPVGTNPNPSIEIQAQHLDSQEGSEASRERKKRLGHYDLDDKDKEKHRERLYSEADRKQIDVNALHDMDHELSNPSESWEALESSEADSFIHPDDMRIRKTIFFFFWMGNFWLSFDNGIIPAC